jgi:uncharacterized protein
VSPDLEKLITLQEIDLKVQQLKTRLTTIPAEREQIKDRFNEFSSAFNEATEKLEESRTERRRLERELEDTQHHHEKYKEDLMKVRNEKEYTTCLREIDSTKKAASQLETQLLQLMEQIETLEAEVSKYAPQVENRRQAVEEELAACDRELVSTEQEIERIKLERDRMASSIPKPLFNNYERVARLRNGIALSEILNGSCSACRMKVRPAAFSQVRKGDQIIICENCSRILYYRSNPEPETAAATDLVRN